jgi:hypothetical protein
LRAFAGVTTAQIAWRGGGIQRKRWPPHVLRPRFRVLKKNKMNNALTVVLIRILDADTTLASW